MPPRKTLVSEEDFDKTVMGMLDELVDDDCKSVALLAAHLFAALGAKLYANDHSVSELEEKLIRALNKDDTEH